MLGREGLKFGIIEERSVDKTVHLDINYLGREVLMKNEKFILLFSFTVALSCGILKCWGVHGHFGVSWAGKL